MSGIGGPEPGEMPAGTTASLQFDDNNLLPLLYGQHDQNLARLEQLLSVSLVSRGNKVAISGPADSVELASDAS